MQVHLFGFGCLVQCLIEHDNKRTAFLNFIDELFFYIRRQSKFGNVSGLVFPACKRLYKGRIWEHRFKQVINSVIGPAGMVACHGPHHPNHLCSQCWRRATNCAVRWHACNRLWISYCNTSIVNYIIASGGAEVSNCRLQACFE